MLSTKYLNDIPDDSRANQHKSLNPDFLSEKNLTNIKALNEIALQRGQTLAQMAIAWVLRKGRITSALIGASRPEQVIDCAKAVDNLSFTDDELERIDRYATDAAINIWAKSAELG